MRLTLLILSALILLNVAGCNSETDVDLSATLSSGTKIADISQTETSSAIPQVPSTEEITEHVPPPVSAETITDPPTEAPTEIPTQAPQFPTDTITPPPVPTDPPPLPTAAPFSFLDNSEYVMIDSPGLSDSLAAMFSFSDSVTDDGRVAEAPPPGRDPALQTAVVPMATKKIPNPYQYFEDVIMIGDSVTTGFDLYRNNISYNDEPVLKHLKVIAVTSYGAYNATRDIHDNSTHPLKDGKQMRPEDIAATYTDARFIYICLGLNDAAWQSPKTFVQYYSELINNITAKNPDKQVAILSITPVVKGHTKGELSNAKITAANNALLEYAIASGIPFIDYGAAIRDIENENSLPTELSSDGYCHLYVPAYNRLLEYLILHPLV
ncbi:hypothetical protein FACS1894219_08840 [Clostridia bacterium]|nr:hypothetical protein FACS1894219_08840 [Clostridia bacterium]